MSSHWGDVAELTFFFSVILGAGTYFPSRRRLEARFGAKQRAQIGWIGLVSSFLASGASLCVRPDVPIFLSGVVFVWGLSGCFFMLLLTDGKFGPFGLRR